MKDKSPLFSEDDFVSDTFRTSLQHLSIYSIMDRVNNGDLNLCPDFHRNAVWSIVQNSRLIESLILGLPLPMFIVGEARWGEWDVIDGVQRLLAITDFILGKYSLESLSYLHELQGLHFVNLPDRYKQRILQTPLVFTVIDSRSSDHMKLEVFQRHNTGGTHLTNQEIRNSMLTGPTRDFLHRLENNEDFLNMTASIGNERMQRQELVMLFLVIVLNYDVNKRTLYINRIHEDVDRFTHVMNNMHSNQIGHLEDLFRTSMHNCYVLFGKKAFQKPNTNFFHKSSFVVKSVVLAGYENDMIETLSINYKEFILDKFNDYFDYKWTPSRYYLEDALNKFSDILKELK